MACDERRVVAYLGGSLDADARAAFERHLLDCEECWSAVRDDRRGRELAERLRSLAPAGLRDRVRAAVELQAGAPPSRRTRRAVVGVAAAVTLALVGAGSVFLSFRSSGDPPVVAEVLRLASSHPDPMPERASAELGGEPVTLTTEMVHGTAVIMAHAAVPFPVAEHGMPLADGRGGPWMAHRDDMTLLALTDPEPVLLVAQMPPADLLAFARDHDFGP